MVLENKERGKSQVAPEFPVLQVACEAEGNKADEGAAVEWERGSLHSGREVVAYGFAMLPLQHVRTESVICKAFCGVAEGVLSGFETDEIGFRRCVCEWIFCGNLVWMI